MPALLFLLRLRQWLRQNTGDELIQSGSRSLMPEFVKICQRLHPRSFGFLILRVVSGQGHGARVSVNDLVDLLVKAI